MNYRPHKQYHATLDFPLGYKEPIQEADEDGQNGKPIWKSNHAEVNNGPIKERFSF